MDEKSGSLNFATLFVGQPHEEATAFLYQVMAIAREPGLRSN